MTISARKLMSWTRKNAKRIAATVLVCTRHTWTKDCVTRAARTLIERRFTVEPPTPATYHAYGRTAMIGQQETYHVLFALRATFCSNQRLASGAVALKVGGTDRRKCEQCGPACRVVRDGVLAPPSYPIRRMLLSDRFDVMVHPEEVRRVVFLLDLHQPGVCRTVGERDAVGFVLGEEVDVRAAAGERL